MRGVESIDVMAELDRLSVKWETAGEDEVRILCPAHEDSTPSAYLNVKKRVFNCRSCGASGDFVMFVALTLKVTRPIALVELQKRYPELAGIAEIPSQTVEKFHAKLQEAGPLLQKLRDRGVTEDMMREARLGFWEGRITIPVYDRHNRCINVRRYLPGAPGPQKMKNTTGHSAMALFNAQTIQGMDTVMVCGGEMKALVAGSLLREYKIAAVAATSGEGNWNDTWTADFKGFDMLICMDVDKAGESAARLLAQRIYGKVKSVKVIRLPLDKDKFPKGDINDWVGQCSATSADFIKLIQTTPEWTPPSKAPSLKGGTAKRMALDLAITNATVGERVEVDAVIAAADQTPFLVPKDLDISCTRSAKNCAVCPVYALPRDADSGCSRMVIDSSAPAVLGVVNSPESVQAMRIAEALGIPTCHEVKFIPRSHHVVHDVRLSPPLDLAGQRVGDSWYPAVIVSNEQRELNVPCRMRGAIHPHPKTQQAIALIDEVEELEDTLSTFNPSAAELTKLRSVFQPSMPSEMVKVMDRVYADIEANVTRIFQRRDMHIALDLAWHSALFFNFAGRLVNGWMNVLIIGDSSQGKSECASRLMAHYGVGDKTDCKNATVAGLLGGLEQLGNRWFVRWGTIPMRDRMLVHLEEVKGMPIEVIARLTEMRSSGFAEIPKIERRRTMARTRLVWTSNPRSPRPMSMFHFGVEAIHELIGSLEDVRRFDLALVVARGEVPDEVINALPSKRVPVEHYATNDICKKLCLWAWTRKPDQIMITQRATDVLVDSSIALCKKFTESVPLVDQGTMRIKLARMAVALAARTFNTPDGANLIVDAHHAQFVYEFVDRVYSSPSMGYAEFSHGIELQNTVQDPHVVLKTLRSTKHPRDLANVLLRRDTVSLDDIASAAALDMDNARTILSLLVRKGALLRVGRSDYAKNSQFISLLKQVQASVKEHDVEGDEF